MKKRRITEGRDQPNQERIRALGEKENYKYLGILEADTIKQVGMKEKNKKQKQGIISDQRENLSKPNSVVGNLSKI